jgi:hypothetical protein
MYQPNTLKEGTKYKLKITSDYIDPTKYENVYFNSYANSPEIVKVQTERGSMEYVLRVRLYELYEEYQNG